MSSWTYLSAFVCAIKLSRRLDDEGHGFPRQLQPIIGCLLEHLRTTRGKPIPIYFHPRTYEAAAFFGTIEVLESKVDIFYDRNRNKCWRRFIVAKELCHLLYDAPGNQHASSNPEEIDSLVTQILAGLSASDFGKDHAISSEQASILMAIELLLPERERVRIEKMISGGSNPLDIAKRFLAPEQMVSVYRNQSYKDLMVRATELLDKER